MKVKFGKTTLRINISFAAAVTLSLILDESGVCSVALFCCFVHEAAHILCLLACGEKPALVELSFYGIKLERLPVRSKRYDILIYAAGPAANLVLYAVFAASSAGNQSVADAAIVSLVIGAFNMLPCRPLDGGNILFECLCRFMAEEKAEKICSGAMWTVIVPLAVAGFFAALEYGNVSLGAVAVYLAAVSFFDKREKGTVKL